MEEGGGPPSIFTYGPPTAVGAPAARSSIFTAGMRLYVSRLIISHWGMIVERFLLGCVMIVERFVLVYLNYYT